jgi:ABC-type transport system involved in multi-copper enzyme maturation permease subunit
MSPRALTKWFRWSNTRQAWQERLVTAGVFAAGLLLWVYGDYAPRWLAVLAWATLALVLAYFLRRGWIKVFGPVLFYDLVRSARRTRTFLVRTAYLALLFLMLCWMYLAWAPHNQVGETIRSSQVAEFSMLFFFTFMAVQLLLIVVMTPGYTAGAITEEKERKTLEFILATDLRNREIVFGKLVSRMAHLSLFILAGLPVLSALQFLGGFDPLALLCGFAGTGLTMMSLACLSILASVLCRRTRDALMLAYLVIVGYLAASFFSLILLNYPAVTSFPSTAEWTSPLEVADLVFGFQSGNPIIVMYRLSPRRGLNVDALPSALGKYALFHGLFAAACAAAATALLRRASLKETGAPRVAARRWRFWHPGVGEWPMLWKEIWLERFARRRLLLLVAMLVLVLLSFLPVFMMLQDYLSQSAYGGRGYGYYWDPWEHLGREMNVWVRSVGMLVAVLGLAGVGVRAATSVRGEHDRDTMTSLLTSPLTSESILFAKWLGSVLSMRWVALWLGLIWLLGLALNGLHPFALPLLVFACVVYAGAMASIGLWYSVVCRTSLRAILATLFTAVLLTAGHWVPWMCCIPCMHGSDFKLLELMAQLQGALTPPAVLSAYFPFGPDDLSRASVSVNDSRHPLWFPFLGVTGVGCWAAFTLVVWIKANQRFKAVGGRIDVVTAGSSLPVAKPVRRVPPKPALDGDGHSRHGDKVRGFRPDGRVIEETDFSG